MIVEQRDYHIHTGKLKEVVGLYEHEGIAIQREHLGELLGWYTTDVGALSTVVSMWAYADYADRETRRVALGADPRWHEFLPKLLPLIHTQQNRILVPTSFSPAR
ncbi:MAG: NIPSNAP family protein [Acidimicrobiia bacterium]|nr:NIPSNAP family protein [Acidimicrobiia bacterium]